MVGIATSVQYLHQDLAIVLMHSRGHAAVIDDVAIGIHGARCRQQPTLAIHRDTAGDHQRGTALGTLAKIGSQFAVVPEAIFEAGVHRAHDDAVAQRGEAEIERSQHIGESSHV